MLHTLLKHLDKSQKFESASAHCDVPCGIYDPSTAQIAVLTAIRLLDLIAELAEKDSLSIADQAKLGRLVAQKEEHVEKAKAEVRIIWGDFFKAPQFETFPNTHNLVHSIMLQGSKTKQHIDRENGIELLAMVNEFAESFWAAKGIETYTATCPYAPAQPVVYPKLG